MKVLAAFALAGLALAAPAVAKPVAYEGRTSGGDTITFKRAGKSVLGVRTLVPTTCVPADEGTPRAGGEIFSPPGRLALRGTVRRSALQEAAMHYGEVTKNYRVSARPRRGGVIAGRLHLNFSFETLIYGWEPKLLGWVCQGDATFTARPRR